jgi:predicted ester cyclase
MEANGKNRGPAQTEAEAVVRRLFTQVIEPHDLRPLHALSDDPALEANLAAAFRAFPDLRVSPERVVAAWDGATVWLRARGTHLGTWRGIEPTGRTVEMRVALHLEVAAGRIVGFRFLADDLATYRSLTREPTLSSTKASVEPGGRSRSVS